MTLRRSNNLLEQVLPLTDKSPDKTWSTDLIAHMKETCFCDFYSILFARYLSCIMCTCYFDVWGHIAVHWHVHHLIRVSWLSLTKFISSYYLLRAISLHKYCPNQLFCHMPKSHLYTTGSVGPEQLLSFGKNIQGCGGFWQSSRWSIEMFELSIYLLINVSQNRSPPAPPPTSPPPQTHTHLQT